MYPAPPTHANNPFRRAIASSERDGAAELTHHHHHHHHPHQHASAPPPPPPRPAPLPSSTVRKQTCIDKLNALGDMWRTQYASLTTDGNSITETMREQVRTLHQLRMLYMNEWIRVLGRASDE